MKQRQDIIEDLVNDLAPFKRSLPYYLYWSIIAVAAAATILVMIARSNFIEVSFNRFFIEIVVVGIMGFWSLFHAFRFADPMTHRVKGIEKTLAGLFLCSCLGMYLLHLPKEYGYFETMSWHRVQLEFICSLQLIGIGLTTGMLVYFLLRRLAPFKIDYISFFSVLGGISFAVLTMRILCTSLSSGHFLVFHYLPAFVGFGGGLLGMKALLKSFGDFSYRDPGK